MNLKTLNVLAGAAHLAALGGVTLAFQHQPRSNRVLTAYRDGIVPSAAGASEEKADKAPVDGCTSVNYPLSTVPAFEMDPKEILQFYFGVSAAAHGFYALDPGGVYTAAVQSGNNPFRWAEYALSASSMMALIAALDGNRNGNAIIMSAGAVAGLNLLGNATEALLRQNERRDYFVLHPRGKSPPVVHKSPLYTATLVAWLMLFLTFATTLFAFKKLLADAKAVPGDHPNPPSWLSLVGYSQLFFFVLFGSVQLFQIHELLKQEKSMARDEVVSLHAYESYEKAYIILSLAAKLTLGGFVTFGLLQRTANCL